jgi:membrane protease YdiL (CAAX protease family)
MNDAPPPPDPGLPPLLGEVTPPMLPKPQPRWRWAVHLILLASYVLGLGLIGWRMRDPAATGDAALPPDTRGLLIMCVSEMFLFASVFFIAWLFSRANARQLFLKWRGGLKPFLWGAVLSVGLRLGIAVIVLVIAAPFLALKGEKSAEESLQKLRPKVENVISTKALDDPTYLALTITLVSFVVAGLREELWRAGMIAGLAGIAPAIFSSRRGQIYAVLIAALVFGIGHTPQGPGAIALTALLGIGLGAIIIWRQSIWEAVLAHGFFDAATFAALWLIQKIDPQLLKSFGIS